MVDDIDELIDLLCAKDNNTAYAALKTLQKESEENNSVYAYMDKFAVMMEDGNSYVRTRGLVLFAYNSKWDVDNKIDEYIDRYIKHIVDKKPITSRQCIKMLPVIAKYKPELKIDIITALQKADISIYADSMQPLVYKDIHEALANIEQNFFIL